MTSATQLIEAHRAASCFECHHTQGSTAKGGSVEDDRRPLILLPPKIDVSHIFTEVVRLTDAGRLK